jgi:hypothetical protein
MDDYTCWPSGNLEWAAQAVEPPATGRQLIELRLVRGDRGGAPQLPRCLPPRFCAHPQRWEWHHTGHICTAHAQHAHVMSIAPAEQLAHQSRIITRDQRIDASASASTEARRHHLLALASYLDSCVSVSPPAQPCQAAHTCTASHTITSFRRPSATIQLGGLHPPQRWPTAPPACHRPQISSGLPGLAGLGGWPTRSLPAPSATLPRSRALSASRWLRT